MTYNEKDVEECIFLERLNRFVARVNLHGEEVFVHVKNTGRCRELLVAGTKGYLVRSHKKDRKYQYDLIAVYKNDILVNIDSQLPNQVVYDFIKAENIISNIITIKREVTYKKSRFDLYVEYQNESGQTEKAFIEVKGVTLFDKDTAQFPDAPTERGAKHLKELVDARKNGYKAYIFFLIQVEGIRFFSGNFERDSKFCEALEHAFQNGVEILCYNSKVLSNSVEINKKVMFRPCSET